MPKIKVEVEVPNHCNSCCYFDRDGMCEFFLKELECLDDGCICWIIRCKECHQAEVEDGKDND